MITLRIFLMGLVVLVAEKGDGGRDRLTVLLQNTEFEHDCSHVHVPVLICDPASRGCECSDGDEIGKKLRLPIAPHGRLLGGVDLRFEPSIEEPLSLRSGLHDTKWWHSWVGAAPVASTMEDIFWIPRFADVLSEEPKIVNKRFLGDASRVFRSEIAARLQLKGGTVRVYSLADLEGVVPSVTFRGESDSVVPKGTKQALADIVVIEAKFDRNKVESEIVISQKMLAAVSDDLSGSYEEIMRLSPDEGGVVDVLLGNLTPLTIGPDRRSISDHFRLYGELAERPQNIHLPVLGTWIRRPLLEPDLPRVIKYVGPGSRGEELGTECKGGDDYHSGSSRPICTVALSEQ